MAYSLIIGLACYYAMKKLSLIITLLLAIVGISNAQELRIITFDYPPYTIAETSAGLVEHRVNKAMAYRSIRPKWEYFPVARSFKEFLADPEAVFAGNIGQFSKTEQQGLRYVVTMKPKSYFVSRAGMKGQSLEKKTFVGLRNDFDMVTISARYNSTLEEVGSTQQAMEMVSRGHADILVCLEHELKDLKKYPNLTILPEYTMTIELQLIYHKNSVVGSTLRKLARETNNFSR